MLHQFKWHILFIYFVAILSWTTHFLSILSLSRDVELVDGILSVSRVMGYSHQHPYSKNDSNSRPSYTAWNMDTEISIN
jgi:hypothetical protein